MPVGRRSSPDPDMPRRTSERQRLVERMMNALESGDRLEADKALVEANRWLKPGNSYIPDAAIENARRRLREAFPPEG
jgi:hypothetical protein